ncbi:MAG: hypothetical protein DRG24_00820 [Epsilonproteobacteria bacterium]|nr:MAG: hypothetical protein DRG24_00820 [Campylobacterota bacterium]
MSQVVQKIFFFKTFQTFLNDWLLFTFSSKLKFAIKVSLSLTLAFMIPMAMGWSQPNTAAITVMLIASVGGVSASVMKGIIRVIGTVIGAALGLTLIAMLPQERMFYLLVLSLLVAVITYLYYAYQGDSTVFLLTAMMIMMIFLQGPENAFIYGVDRTYMTVFGIVVYTLVGLFLWPVRLEDTTKQDAAVLTNIHYEFFTSLITRLGDSLPLQEKMIASEQKMQHAYVRSSGGSLDMTLHADVWDSITNHYKNIGAILSALATIRVESEPIDYSEYIENYNAISSEISAMFKGCEAAWKHKRQIMLPNALAISYRSTPEEGLSHLQKSAIVTQAEMLRKLHLSLRKLSDRLNTLNGGDQTVHHDNTMVRISRFVWFDPEYMKATLQLFSVFWFSTAFWILFNPPGGFMIVLLATLLGLLTTFSPLRPTILMILFSIGFLFATLMYVFVLPHLVYGWELALFMFLYTFIAFYMINLKLTIFFLLGMFVLGINNTMNYNFALFLNILLVFYMFLIILMLFYHFPFSARPEHLFSLMKKRFFKHTSALLELGRNSQKESWLAQKKAEYHQRHLFINSAKMRLWGSQIDTSYFSSNSKEEIMAFALTCEKLAYKLQLLYADDKENENNTLLIQISAMKTENIMAEVAGSLTEDNTLLQSALFESKEAVIEQIEAKLNDLKQSIDPDDHTVQEISGFYVNLALRYSVWIALERSHNALQTIDWNNLKANKF